MNNCHPLESLAHALVRDGTARFFRWKRQTELTRHPKIPITIFTGRFKTIRLSDDVRRLMQRHMRCDCRLSHCRNDSFSTALIGGKRFRAGERLCFRVRCGSVVTMVKHGRSVYGLLKHFYRVVCRCNQQLYL